MFKSWLICCRKGSSQLEGQNHGLGPPLPSEATVTAPFHPRFISNSRVTCPHFLQASLPKVRGLNRQPPPPTSRGSTSHVHAGPVRDLPDFRSTPASCCMHFTPVLFYSPALITPGSLQFWVVISSQAPRVQAPPYAEPRPPQGYAPPACLLPLESPSLAAWLPLSVEARGGASPPQRSSQRKSIWTCRSHHR